MSEAPRLRPGDMRISQTGADRTRPPATELTGLCHSGHKSSVDSWIASNLGKESISGLRFASHVVERFRFFPIKSNPRSLKTYLRICVRCPSSPYAAGCPLEGIPGGSEKAGLTPMCREKSMSPPRHGRVACFFAQKGEESMQKEKGKSTAKGGNTVECPRCYQEVNSSNMRCPRCGYCIRCCG